MRHREPRLCIIRKCARAAALFLLCLQGMAATAQSCGDDQRLADLPAILQSGQSPAPPLTLLPETFVRLHPSARAALGDAILICPGTPLSAEGRPLLRPVKVPFPDLWEKIEICVGRGDWAEIVYLRDNFSAAPLPPEAVFSLLVMPPYSEKNMKQLAQTLHITSFSDGNMTRFFVADVYSALGGRATEKLRLGVAESLDALSRMRTKAEALGRSESLAVYVYGGNWREHALRSLKRCGLDAVPASAVFRE